MTRDEALKFHLKDCENIKLVDVGGSFFAREDDTVCIYGVIKVVDDGFYVFWDLGRNEILGVSRTNNEIVSENIEFPKEYDVYEMLKPIGFDKLVSAEIDEKSPYNDVNSKYYCAKSKD